MKTFKEVHEKPLQGAGENIPVINLIKCNTWDLRTMTVYLKLFIQAGRTQ